MGASTNLTKEERRLRATLSVLTRHVKAYENPDPELLMRWRMARINFNQTKAIRLRQEASELEAQAEAVKAVMIADWKKQVTEDE